MLVKELKELNSLLRKTTGTKAKVQKAKDVEGYLHLFADNYVPAFGKGAAYLTLGVIGALLANMGLGGDRSEVLAHLK